MTTPSPEEIGRKIKAHREHNGWSQSEFASRLSGGLQKQSTISEIERGRRGLQVSELFEIAEVLGVHPYHHLLVTGNDSFMNLDQVDQLETILLNGFRNLPNENARMSLISLLVAITRGGQTDE